MSTFGKKSIFGNFGNRYLNCIFTVILGLLCQASVSQAAVFNFPSHLINIPVYQPFNGGEFEYGSLTSLSDPYVYDFDFMLNYAVSDRLKVGMTVLNSTDVVGNLHFNFYRWRQFWNLGLAAGVLNITQNKTPSEWDIYKMEQVTNMAPYLVGSCKFPGLTPEIGPFEVSVGFGKKRFERPAAFQNVKESSGVFYGVGIDILDTKLMMEYDGKDSNVGMRFKINETTDINLALTELGVNRVTNPYYNNAPVRFVSFGLTIRQNYVNYYAEKSKDVVSKVDSLEHLISKYNVHYKDLLSELDAFRSEKRLLQKKVSKLQNTMKNEAQYMYEDNQQLKEEKRRRYLGISSVLGEKVLKLYYDSFEYFYQNEYMKSVEVLTKAIHLDPYVPILYIRLGSVYYKMGLKKDAMDNWQKALELDPYNEQLKDLIRKPSDDKLF